MSGDQNIAKMKPSLYLYDFIKKKIDLAEFLETEAGCNLHWLEPNVTASTECPMPNHNETKPSFMIKYIEEDNVWVYHCLGCDAKGTIIDFCMQYYGFSSSAVALMFLCEKFGFKDSAELAASCFKDIKKTVNLQKKIEFSHIVTANQCRMLLRKDYEGNKQWVADAYRKMNELLDHEDVQGIEEIGMEASQRGNK